MTAPRISVSDLRRRLEAASSGQTPSQDSTHIASELSHTQLLKWHSSSDVLPSPAPKVSSSAVLFHECSDYSSVGMKCLLSPSQDREALRQQAQSLAMPFFWTENPPSLTGALDELVQDYLKSSSSLQRLWWVFDGHGSPDGSLVLPRVGADGKPVVAKADLLFQKWRRLQTQHPDKLGSTMLTVIVEACHAKKFATELARLAWKDPLYLSVIASCGALEEAADDTFQPSLFFRTSLLPAFRGLKSNEQTELVDAVRDLVLSDQDSNSNNHSSSSTLASTTPTTQGSTGQSSYSAALSDQTVYATSITPSDLTPRSSHAFPTRWLLAPGPGLVQVSVPVAIKKGVHSLHGGPAPLHRDADRIRDFVGRRWLTAAVRAFVNEQRSSDVTTVLLIDGTAGIGKTSWALALWARRLLSDDANVVLHRARFDDEPTCTPMAWLRSFIVQVGILLSDEGFLVDWSAFSDLLGPGDATPEQRLLNFTDMVNSILTQSIPAQVGTSDKFHVLFLTDGLDEVDEGRHAWDFLYLMGVLAKLSLPWLTVAATTRPTEGIGTKSRDLADKLATRFRTHTIAPGSQDHQNDLMEWLETRNSPRLTYGLKKAILANAKGCFLYAKHVVDDIIIHDLDLNEDNLPPEITHVYQLRLSSRWGPGSVKQPLMTLLTVLVAAKAVLPQSLLLEAAANVEPADESVYRDILTYLSPMLEGVGDEDPDGGVRIFHKSFADWIKNNGWKHRDTQSGPEQTWTAQDAAGHSGLAKAGLKSWMASAGMCSQYVVRWVVAHAGECVVQDIKTDVFENMASRWRWMVAKSEFDGWLEVGNQLRELGPKQALSLGKLIGVQSSYGKRAVADHIALAGASFPDLQREAAPDLNLAPVSRGWATEEALIARLVGHKDLVECVVSLAGVDPWLIATGSSDTTIKLWSAKHGGRAKATLRVDSTEKVKHLLVCGEGDRFLLACMFDGTVRLWDVDAAKLLYTLRVPLVEELWSLLSLDPGSDTVFLLTGAQGLVAKVRMDLVLHPKSGIVEKSELVLDKSQFLGRDPNKPSHDVAREAILFPTPRHIVVAVEGDLVVLDTDLNLIRSLEKVHDDDITRLFVASPDKLVSVGLDRAVRVWNGELDQVRVIVPPEALPRRMHSGIHLEDNLILVGGNPMSVWDIEDGTLHGVLQGHSSRVCDVVKVEALQSVVSCGYGDEIIVWDRTSLAKDVNWLLPGQGSDASSGVLLPDSGLVVLGGEDGDLTLYEVVSGAEPRLVQELTPGHKGRMVAFLVIPSGFVSCSWDHTAGVWLNPDSPAGTWTRSVHFTKHTDRVECVTTVDGGRTVITGSKKEIYRWDPATGDDTFHVDVQAVTLGVLTPTVLVAGGPEGALRTVSLESGVVVGEQQVHGKESASWMAVVDDGRCVFTWSRYSDPTMRATVIPCPEADPGGWESEVVEHLDRTLVSDKVDSDVLVRFSQAHRTVELWNWRTRSVVDVLVHVDDAIQTALLDQQRGRLVVILKKHGMAVYKWNKNQ